jgi:glucokinase-like ROK family protein
VRPSPPRGAHARDDGGSPPPEVGATATVGRILRIIRDRGPLAASDIVRISGLAKSTVSINVERLLEAGLVRQEARPGSKRRKLRLAESAGFVVGVDVGQTHLAVALCDLEADILHQVRTPVSLVKETPEAILARASQMIGELARRAGVGRERLLGIGVGLPGPVDYARGVPVSPPVMPGWDRFPVVGRLGARFGCPVFVDNDVNVMALGERNVGAAQEAEDLLFVKVGTGIGAGLVARGRIYRGAKGAAGDIGHIGIDGDATPCRCGNRGCLEAVAGGAGLSVVAERMARDGTSDFLAQRAARGEPLDAAALSLGATAGDEACVRALMDSGRKVGDVLAKLVNFFNPSLIVVGGGVALVGERYIASIREAVYRRSTPLATADLVVKKSALGEDAGVIGAAVLVLDEILSHRNVSRMVRGAAPGERAAAGGRRPRSAGRTRPATRPRATTRRRASGRGR